MKSIKTRHGVPLAAMAFLVLLALGAIGLGTGSWSEQLTINGTVDTAQIEVKLLTAGNTCNDLDKEGKDFSSTKRVAIVDPDDDEKTKIVVTTVNGYPGYHAKCNFTLVNNGKLPVVVGIPTFKWFPPLSGCFVFEGPGSKVTLDCDQLMVEYLDGFGETLQLGAESFSGLNIDIKKGAVEKENYSFEVQPCVAINSKPDCGGGQANGATGP